jgi:hypothetical protein
MPLKPVPSRIRAIRLGIVAAGMSAVILGANGCSRKPRPAAGALFTDVTRSAGIRFVHDNGGYGRKLYPERMGSGVAFFDANGDGLLDIFLVNGAPLPGHPPAAAQPSRLYINRGDGTFEDRTRGSGLEQVGYGMGVAAGDFDNDGREDLYVTRLGKNSLYHNNGDGTFTDVTAQAGVAAGGFSTSAAWVDYDGDGLLDLYVCRYIPWNSLKDEYLCTNPEGEKTYCSVHVYEGMQHLLFHNLGRGRFADVSRESGIAGKKARGLALVCGDYDRDGRPDIFVANDETPNFLWHNLGHGKFEEAALRTGFAFNDRGNAPAGMGLDIADADGDGNDDVIESDFQNVRKTLYLGDSQGFFVANGGNKGLGDMTLHRLGFGIGFLDYDLDGWPDLFVANGHVTDDLAKQDPAATLAQPAQLFHNQGQGYYTDASAALGQYAAQPRVGRGVAFGDFDNDGDTDILIANNGQEPVLLRNDNRHENHWLGVRCIGTRSNRSGLGVRVTIQAGRRTQSLETRAAKSYLSSSDPRVLFGLGKERRVDRLTLRWPSGLTQEFANLPADRYLTFTEGKAASG